MPGIASGEVFAWAEGKLYLYASGSGSTSGSGIGFAEGARVRLSYGWSNYRNLSGGYHDILTGRRADLSVDVLYADRTLYALANGTAAVNAKFEGVTTGVAAQSAQYILYSGKIDSFDLAQIKDDMFRASLSMHANTFSGFGG